MTECSFLATEPNMTAEKSNTPQSADIKAADWREEWRIAAEDALDRELRIPGKKLTGRDEILVELVSPDENPRPKVLVIVGKEPGKFNETLSGQGLRHFKLTAQLYEMRPNGRPGTAVDIGIITRETVEFPDIPTDRAGKPLNRKACL